jgi:hypothetical protein
MPIFIPTASKVHPIGMVADTRNGTHGGAKKRQISATTTVPPRRTFAFVAIPDPAILKLIHLKFTS